MDKPNVIIGITSRNRASILPKAICSALSQTYKNKEIWIYDDASTDSTKELQYKFPDVHWVIGNENKGLVYARNLLMKKEGFSYFCSLDDDAWFIDETAIERALNYIQTYPNIGALGFDMLSPEVPEHKTFEPYFSHDNNFIGCGHIINLAAAKKIGYYTENPGFYGGEEKDFCIKLMDAGFHIITFNGMYVWHDKTTIARDFPKQYRSNVCNDLVFAYRRTPLWLLIPGIATKLYKHLKYSISFKDGELLQPLFKGILDFFIWSVTKKTFRDPVKLSTFRKFIALGKTDKT